MSEQTLATIVNEIQADLERDVIALPLSQEGQQRVVDIVFTALRKVADFLTKDNDAGIAAMNQALTALECVDSQSIEVVEAIKALRAQLTTDVAE